MYLPCLEGALFGTARGVCLDRDRFSAINVRYQCKEEQASPLDRQITVPENRASAELNSPNPIEQELEHEVWRGGFDMLSCERLGFGSGIG